MPRVNLSRKSGGPQEAGAFGSPWARVGHAAEISERSPGQAWRLFGTQSPAARKEDRGPRSFGTREEERAVRYPTGEGRMNTTARVALFLLVWVLLEGVAGAIMGVYLRECAGRFPVPWSILASWCISIALGILGVTRRQPVLFVASILMGGMSLFVIFGVCERWNL